MAVKRVAVKQKSSAKKLNPTAASGALSGDVLKHCGEVALIFASLSHPVRLKILCHLMDGEKRVSDLTEYCEISQPAMSQFLKRMKRDGLLESRKEGTVVFYRLQDDRLIRLLSVAREVYVES